MTTLIAVHTIRGAHQTRVPTEAQLDRNPHDKGDFEPVTVLPGAQFDTTELGISDAEAKTLIASGAVRELGRLEAAEQSAATDVAHHPPASEDDLPSDEELNAMSRADLDTLAHERGVDISKAKNKGDVIDALVASLS